MQQIPAISKPLQRWIDRHKARKARSVSIFDVILNGKFLPYFLHRSRFSAMSIMMRFFIHSIELFFVWHVVPDVFRAFFFARIAALILEQGWWGILEDSRTRARSLHKQRDLVMLRSELNFWLRMAAALSSIIILMTLIMAYVLYSSNSEHSLLILVIGIQTCLRIFLRTYYSAAYALKRVYIPFSSIFFVEIVTMIIILQFHDALGIYALILSILVSSSVLTYVSFVSSKKIMEFFLISSRHNKIFAQNQHKSPEYSFKKLLPPSLALISFCFHEVFFCCILYYMSESYSLPQEYLLMAFILLPIFRGVLNWGRLIYFDMVHERADNVLNFREYFERKGMGFILLLASFYFILGALVCWFVFNIHEMDLYLAAYSYLLVCGVYGYICMCLYTKKQYAKILITTTMHYALLIFMVWYCDNPKTLAYQLMLPLIISSVIGVLFLRKHVEPENHDVVLNRMMWLKKLANQTHAVNIADISFTKNTKASHIQYSISRLKNLSQGQLSVCVHNQHVYVWQEQGTPHTLGYDDIINCCAGHAVNLAHYNFHCPKNDYNEIIKTLFDIDLTQSKYFSKQEVIDAASTLSEETEVITLMQSNPFFLLPENQYLDIGAIWNRVVRAQNGHSKSKLPGYKIIPLWDRGWLNQVLLIPQQALFDSNFAGFLENVTIHNMIDVRKAHA